LKKFREFMEQQDHLKRYGAVKAKQLVHGKRHFVYFAPAKTAMLADRNQEISTDPVDSIIQPLEDLCK
jgi:hypothetical protein